MFRRLHNRRGQSTLEYAILIAVIVAALLAMQTYMKRGYQGKLRENADNIGEQFTPENTLYSYTTTSGSTSTDTLNVAGDSKTAITRQTTDKSGTETVGALTGESMGF